MLYKSYFFFFSSRDLREVPQPIAVKFCHMVGSMFNLQMPVHKFGELSLKKILGTKNAKFGPILDPFSV